MDDPGPDLTPEVIRLLSESDDLRHQAMAGKIRDDYREILTNAKEAHRRIVTLKKFARKLKLVTADALVTPQITSERYEEIWGAMDEFKHGIFETKQKTSALADSVTHTWERIGKMAVEEAVLKPIMMAVLLNGLQLAIAYAEYNLALTTIWIRIDECVRAMRNHPDVYIANAQSVHRNSAQLYQEATDLEYNHGMMVSQLETEIADIETHLG